MEKLIIKSKEKVRDVNTAFIRDFIAEVDWNDRLIGLKGARGVGKTTLVLQYIKKYLHEKHNALYLSLDDLYFSANRLIDLANRFYKYGGTHLFIDEVHRYPDWAREIKLIYDDIHNLKIIFTGSSILDIINAKADLSRRAMVYDLKGLSFREYLNLNYNQAFEKISLDDILYMHEKLAYNITDKIKVLPAFKEYLSFGYYPYFMENRHNYLHRLSETIKIILDIDLPVHKNMSAEAIGKLRKLLFIVAGSVPFKPNISKLSDITGISRNTLVIYLNYLEEASVINLLHTTNHGIGYLRKPEKIYLENPNLLFALRYNETGEGNIRETFFLNQVKTKHDVHFGGKGDFIIDNKYLVEVGGPGKSFKQISGQPSAFIAADETESGIGNKIPLWLWGFLY